MVELGWILAQLTTIIILQILSQLGNRQGFKIACLEEIALKNNWINKNNIKKAISFYGNCIYSSYLKKLIK